MHANNSLLFLSKTHAKDLKPYRYHDNCHSPTTVADLAHANYSLGSKGVKLCTKMLPT